MAGIDLVGIPYTGGAQVVADLLGGNVQLYFGSRPPPCHLSNRRCVPSW